MKKRKVLVTGGCGFVGVNLVKYLLEKRDCHILVYDNLSAGSEENLTRAIHCSERAGEVHLTAGDVLDGNLLDKIIRGVDTVVHLAAHTSIVDSLQRPSHNFSVNVAGTFNVLESARKNGVKKLIFASSNAALGQQNPPIDENMIPKPLSPYGAGKLAGEAFCSGFCRSYGMNTVSLRFANVYGPYSEHKTSVVAEFIRRVKHGKVLTIYGDGKQTRDFVHVRDICQAIFLSMNPDSTAGEVFQIGTGVETPIIEVARMNILLAGEKGIKTVEPRFKADRKGEIRRNYSNIGKARKYLGFNPTVKLEHGLKDLWADFG